MELKSEIDTFIHRIVKPSKQELKIINDTDWSVGETTKSREGKYSVQKLFTTRAMANMKKLFDLAEDADQLKNSRVRNTLKLLREYYTIMDARYEAYTEDVSWMSIDTDNKKEVAAQESEAKFQSTILTDLQSHEAILRDISLREDDNRINIKIHGDTPAPFLMREVFHKRFPEIKPYMKKKNDGL